MPSVILRPNGPGTYTEWGQQVPASTFHWDKVDEAVADGDTTYIFDNTWLGTERDSFSIDASSLPTTGITISKITVTVRARYSDAAGSGAVLKQFIRAGSTDAESAAFALAAAAAYGDFSAEWATNPATGVQWTPAQVAALEIGFRNAMPTGVPWGLHVTQVYVTVDYRDEYLTPAENWLLVYENGTDNVVGGIVNVLPGSRILESVSTLELLECQVAKDATNTALLTIGREIGFWRQYEGEIFRGKIFGKKRSQRDGAAIWSISAACLGIELQKQMTWIGVKVADLSASATVAKLLAEADETAWTSVLTGSGFVNIADRYDNQSVLEAMGRFSEEQNAFYRFSKTTLREIEIVRESAHTGMLLTNVDNFDVRSGSAQTIETIYGYFSPDYMMSESYFDPEYFMTFESEGEVGPGSDVSDRDVGLLEELTEEAERDVINRIYPIGLREGNVVLDLELSTRGGGGLPYPIHSGFKNSPSVVDVVSATVSINESEQKNIGTINSMGRNRCAIVFFSSTTGLTAISFPPRISIGGDMHGHDGAFATPGSEKVCVFLFNSIPEGRIEVVIDRSHPDVNGEVCQITAITLQDGIVPAFSDPGSKAHNNEGTGTAAQVTHPTLTGAEPGALLLGICHTTSNRTITSDVDQTRLATFADTVVDSKLLDTNVSEMSWTLSSSVAWGCVEVVVKLAKHRYIEDLSSINAYGLSEWTMIEPSAKNITYALRPDVADTLYDLAATRMDRMSTPPMERKWKVAWLPLGPLAWKVGNQFDIVWHNQSEAIEEVDQYCVTREQTFDAAGVRHWNLTLSNRPVVPKITEDYLAETLKELAAIEADFA